MTLRRPRRLRLARRLRRRGSASSSTEITSPRSPIRAAIWPVLIPGPAQRSSTCSPGWGSSTSTTAAEPRLCGVSSPAATSVGHGRRRCGPSTTIVSGAAPAARLAAGRRAPRRRPRAALASAASRSPRSVLTRSATSAGSLQAASSERARLGARAPPTTSAPARAAPSGRPRRASGVESSPSSAAVSCVALAGGAAQDRVDEAGGVGGAGAA